MDWYRYCNIIQITSSSLEPIHCDNFNTNILLRCAGLLAQRDFIAQAERDALRLTTDADVARDLQF
jgi:hypothetical protein